MDCRLAAGAMALAVLVTAFSAVQGLANGTHTTSDIPLVESSSPATAISPQKIESAVSSSSSVMTSLEVNIPTQGAVFSVSPSLSSSLEPSHSGGVTYHSSEGPSSTPTSTTVRTTNIPLSSVATPSLTLSNTLSNTVASENIPPLPVTVEGTTADAASTQLTDDKSVDSTQRHSSVTPGTPISSSSIMSSVLTTSVLPSSPSSSVQINPSPTIDINPTVSTVGDVTTETATSESATSESAVELTSETTSQVKTTSVSSEGDQETSSRPTTTTDTSTTTESTTALHDKSKAFTSAESNEATTQSSTSQRPSTTLEITTESKREPTESPTEETTSESTARSTEIPTTQPTKQEPITMPTTFEPSLNTSEAYDEFWIITVLKIQEDINVLDRDFGNDMEMKLAQLFYEGLVGRRKRAATYKNTTTVQMIMVNRSEADPQLTSFTYYVRHNGHLVPADEAVRIISDISSQRLAIVLGHEVITKGKVYKKGPDRKLWIIGAVIGALVVLVSLIWCILFIYFKCTRPAGKRSPRPQRSNRTIDPESSFRAKKDFRLSQRDLRGFDIVRTEVGLESEIQREKGRSSDSYRRMAGSSELEGMYSPGDTPPPDAPLVQPSHDAMVSSRPNSKVHSLSRPLPSLPGSIGRKGKGKKTREESSEGETTGSEKPLTPANKNQGRKKGRGWIRGHSEESDEDSDDEEDKDGPTRTTHHGVRLPPLPNPPYPSESYRDSFRQQQQLEESMKSKAESERQRNKQRQRDKKKEKKSKKDLKKEAEAKKAYKMVQKEMGKMMEEHSPHQPNVFVEEQKSKSKRKRQQQQQQQNPNFRDSFELSELAAVHQQVEQDLRGLSSLRGDSDEESKQKAFEEARQRMHALLDDAFALIAPNPSDEEQDPDLDSQQPVKDDNQSEKRHTPLSINSSSNRNEKPIWSTYSAADILAKIPLDELPEIYKQKFEEELAIDPSSVEKPRKKRKGFKEEVNPAYEDSLKKNHDTRKIGDKDYDDDSGYRTPGGRNRASRVDNYSSAVLDSKLFIPTGKVRAHSPPERDSDLISTSQIVSSGKYKLNDEEQLPGHPNEVMSDGLDKKTNKKSNKIDKSDKNGRPSSPSTMDIYSIQKEMVQEKEADDRKERLKPNLEPNEDEMDVIQKTVRHGVKEQPIVNSIREELMRLAHRSSQDNEVS